MHRVTKYVFWRCCTAWGPKAYNLLCSSKVQDKGFSRYNGIAGKLGGYFVPPASKLYESAQLRRHIQQVGEPVDAFFTAVGSIVSDAIILGWMRKSDWSVSAFSSACTMLRYLISLP